MQVPPLIFIELHFKTLLPINNLPFYHGPQWSALFRNILKPYLPEDSSMSKAGIWIHPVETGVLSYTKDEIIHLGMTFPFSHSSNIARMLEEFNSIKVEDGHFLPGKTIFLEKIYCRISGDSWEPEDIVPMSEEHLKDEVEMLIALKEFTIHFHSPLRLPRPKGYKIEGHHFCDEDFFLNNRHGVLPINHLINKVRIEETLSINNEALNITGGALTWLDVSYGYEIKKTIGGVVGKLKVSGTPNQNAAQLLVVGQYAGAGKNPSFGFGFYNIPELDAVKKIRQLSRGKTILQRALSLQRLREALNKLPNSSPGADMLTVDDIKKAGDALLEKLNKNVTEGAYKHGELKKYKLQKDDGSFREIYVQNVVDRLLHRAISDYLISPVDRLLSDSSYAYRRGLNRKGAALALKKALNEGYTSGIKADISAFFDSVDLENLFAILEGLFPFEPLVKKLPEWLPTKNLTSKGLPQGSPLSPLLSNLYLDRFDRYMEKEGLRLIRYADDFVVLFKEGNSSEEVLLKVEKCLSDLGLSLRHEKTSEIKQGRPISFLGYVITSSEVSEQEKESDTDYAQVAAGMP